MAQRDLSAANRSKMAEKKEKQRAMVSESHSVKVPVLQVSIFHSLNECTFKIGCT